MMTKEQLENFIRKCDTNVLQRVSGQPCTATEPEMKRRNALCQELIALELQRRTAIEDNEQSKVG